MTATTAADAMLDVVAALRDEIARLEGPSENVRARHGIERGEMKDRHAVELGALLARQNAELAEVRKGEARIRSLRVALKMLEPDNAVEGLDVVCGVCGFVARSPGGLGRHRQTRHPTHPPKKKPAKPAPPAPAAAQRPAQPAPRPPVRPAPPAPPAPPPGGLVLHCSECPAELPTIDELFAHTRSQHGRRPTTLERIPGNPNTTDSQVPA